MDLDTAWLDPDFGALVHALDGWRDTEASVVVGVVNAATERRLSRVARDRFDVVLLDVSDPKAELVQTARRRHVACPLYVRVIGGGFAVEPLTGCAWTLDAKVVRGPANVVPITPSASLPSGPGVPVMSLDEVVRQLAALEVRAVVLTHTEELELRVERLDLLDPELDLYTVPDPDVDVAAIVEDAAAHGFPCVIDVPMSDDGWAIYRYGSCPGAPPPHPPPHTPRAYVRHEWVVPFVGNYVGGPVFASADLYDERYRVLGVGHSVWISSARRRDRSAFVLGLHPRIDAHWLVNAGPVEDFGAILRVDATVGGRLVGSGTVGPYAGAHVGAGLAGPSMGGIVGVVPMIEAGANLRGDERVVNIGVRGRVGIGSGWGNYNMECNADGVCNWYFYAIGGPELAVVIGTRLR